METSIRLDKWLFFCRFFKSRALAANVVESGAVRLNGAPVTKPAHGVRPGDRVAFPAGPYIRTVEVLAPGTRRGPAPEAQGLYRDLGKERAPEE
ncbi:Ribosome-associated heat shock protein implicated in the recycling of the 50S subunit [Paramagnetospirillum magnetotacticum MS-1]|uniref:Ribosome-associated heat shock protein implicated in the recycling of the 50S subunit n=1 Tax=Paramagnetospirillum magnetotacticum MS-1 TaxID=272627 RepID=A0A0C2YTD5_PARME|nr:RNA-binding S4 domain-containing protein [Paramagnetospirillum magnetotacticum]KIL97965.1 Ribosome-associated heat shock protein implicated in the recycling of the 50S subunit [Paramagnetospirillum magnetotacticum MS-1]